MSTVEWNASHGMRAPTLCGVCARRYPHSHSLIGVRCEECGSRADALFGASRGANDDFRPEPGMSFRTILIGLAISLPLWAGTIWLISAGWQAAQRGELPMLPAEVR